MQESILLTLLKDAIDRARDVLETTKTAAPNSYGHGFDVGYMIALQQVYNTITGNWNDIVLPELEV